MDQGTLDSFTKGESEDDDNESESNVSASGQQNGRADLIRAGEMRDEHPVEDGRSCPYCGAGDTAFIEPKGDIGDVSCEACGAVVPVNQEWYQNGVVFI